MRVRASRRIPVQIDATAVQRLSGDAFTQSGKSEEYVFGTDLVLTQLRGFTLRELEHLFRSWSEWATIRTATSMPLSLQYSTSSPLALT